MPKTWAFAPTRDPFAVSPDGRTVVFTRLDGVIGNSRLTLVQRDVATGAESFVVPGVAANPVFSPEGKLAFRRYDEVSGVWVKDSLTAPAVRWHEFPALSLR